MNNSTTIENSGTYQILVSMGFSSAICKSATKIYLNDIEEAVTYCSDLSTPASIDSNDSNDDFYDYNSNKQGINFKKCYDLLQISYPQYLSLFINWFKEEEFEDEQLIEEFIENNDYSESFFIQYIEDNIDNFFNISFNNNIAIQLFYDLNNAITNDPISNKMYNSSKILSKPPMIQRRSQFIGGYSDVFEDILIDGYIREITNVLPYANIPWKLYVLCHAYYPKFDNNTINIDIDTANNKHLINETKSLFKSECFKLYDSLCPKELFSLLIIGKDNNIPLLTYLIDSYNRYKIHKCSKFNFNLQCQAKKYYSAVERKLAMAKYRSTHKLNNISIEEFISNKCLIFNDYPSFQDTCIKSMEYLTSISKLGESTMECEGIYRINDSLLDYTNYICETYKFVHNYINNLSYSSMPCQFELIIIPKNVSDIDTHENIPFDCNIYNLLLNANIPFVELETFGIFPDLNQIQKITQKLIGNKKNQRICILIDRRDCDKMYIYRMKDEINSKKEFVNESLFNNSINCLIPNLCGCNEIEKLNGYLFSLSFHIISKYEVRIYLNINGFTTRFFITDLITYIPHFFQTNNLNWIHNRKSENVQKIIKNMKGIKNILSDSKFDEFYKLILMEDKKPYAKLRD